MTNTKIKPATALPWHVTADPRPASKQPCIATTAAGLPVILATVCGGQRVTNAAYIAHACNAYPQLVARIHNNIAVHDEMDDDGMNIRCTCQQCGANRELLRSLGELE